MHKALYRTWRPATFDEVVGQEHITTTLKNEIASGRPAHAYLLIGSRGTGKTTCARILAKAVNCQNPTQGNPCTMCDICTGVDNGSMVDIVEIDAASNNGVDNIRQLREEATFLPNITKYRVYIIDEVHMLSPSAFNALLKILEEPPSHVIFVLATTEAHKVPATILSRCQRFDFRRIDSEVITKRLCEVAGAEGFELSTEAGLLIARMADGGMRDALSILDLCASYNRDISVQTVSTATGLVQQDYLFALCDAANKRDLGRFWEQMSGVGGQHVEYDRLCEQLLSHYRNLMVAKSSKNPDELIICLPEVLTRYKEQAQECRMEDILAAMNILQRTLVAMTRTPHRKTELEMAAVQLCHPEISQPIVSTPQARVAPKAQADTTTPQPPQPTTATAEPVEIPTPKTPAISATQTAPTTPPVLFERWAQVMELLSGLNPALCGFLGGSSAYVQGGRILIDCKNKMFLELVRTNEQAKNDLKQAIEQVSGQAMAIGPYHAEQPTTQADTQPTQSPLDAMLNQARQAGIPIETK